MNYYICAHCSYTRNLVEGGEGDRYNLLILCWNPQKGSPIHDHDESSCFLKVLEGELEETKYAVPTKGERLEMTHNAVHGEGTLTYMDSKEMCSIYTISLPAIV